MLQLQAGWEFKLKRAVYPEMSSIPDCCQQLESRRFNQSTSAIRPESLPPLAALVFLKEAAPTKSLPSNFFEELLSTKSLEEILRDKRCLLIEGDDLGLARTIWLIFCRQKGHTGGGETQTDGFGLLWQHRDSVHFAHIWWPHSCTSSVHCSSKHMQHTSCATLLLLSSWDSSRLRDEFPASPVGSLLGTTALEFIGMLSKVSCLSHSSFAWANAVLSSILAWGSSSIMNFQDEGHTRGSGELGFRSAAHAIFLCCRAMPYGECPMISVTSRSAPHASNSRTHSTEPERAARCRGELPCPDLVWHNHNSMA